MTLNAIKIVLSAGIVLALSACSHLSVLFFYPQTVWISTPDDVGLQYDNLFLTTVDDTTVHGWWIPAQPVDEHAVQNTVVLFLHGNAENISSHSRSLYWLARRGIDVLALDYRGFGASEGRASLPQVMQDIEAATLWLRAHHGHKKLVILGQSIGSALALQFVAQTDNQYAVDALILDAPLRGFARIARHLLSENLLGWLFLPATVFLPSRWDPEDLIERISIPVLIMHSPEDHVIPYAHGRYLFERLQRRGPESVQCWLESRGAHIASFAYADLRDATYEFLQNERCPTFTQD